METEKKDVKISFNKSVSKVNSLIMLYVPMEKLNKQQPKFLQKPWFSTAIKTSIRKRNQLFKQFIEWQNFVLKMINMENIIVTEMRYPPTFIKEIKLLKKLQLLFQNKC